MHMHRVEVVVRLAGDLWDVVHVPAGHTVWIGTTPVIARAGTEAAFGLVTITMEATSLEPPIPRQAMERRPYPFGAASLLAHLALVVTAFVDRDQRAPLGSGDRGEQSPAG